MRENESVFVTFDLCDDDDDADDVIMLAPVCSDLGPG